MADADTERKRKKSQVRSIAPDKLVMEGKRFSQETVGLGELIRTGDGVGVPVWLAETVFHAGELSDQLADAVRVGKADHDGGKDAMTDAGGGKAKAEVYDRAGPLLKE